MSGRVQGVFYRDTCRREAEAAGVAGWARNLHDGRVEICLEGKEGGVKGVIEWCRSGTPWAEVTSVEEKAGWKIELKKDASGKIVGATWSGSTIAPRAVGEFGFVARNPAQETTLVWKVVQIYEDESKSEWTGARGTRSPAPVTTIKPQ